MRIRSLTVLLALCTPMAALCAQIIRAGRLEPQTWVSGGVGLLQVQRIEDYKTGTTWDYGTIVPWRAGIERTLRNGGALGLVGALARPTFAYSDAAGGCDPCDAHGNFFQALAVFRSGGGLGFHQVIELYAGVTGFSNLRQKDTEERLPPTETVLDPTFAVGYGFAYGFGRGTHLVLVQEVGAMLHRRDDAPSGANTLRQFQQTRIGLRLGLGG
jgi:hypothetical protein